MYYTRMVQLLDTIDITKRSHLWASEHVVPLLTSFGEIYANLSSYDDVRVHSLSFVFKLFRAVSYLDDESVFKSLDENYLKLSIDNCHYKEFLSFINPSYLAKYHKNLVKYLSVVKPSNLTAIRNLIADENCFNLIKEDITTHSMLSMPYMEQMVLLEKLSQYPYSVNFMIHCLPMIMSNLIENPNGEVIETETVELRRTTVENLLKFSEEDLNVWYIPLKKLYATMRNGTTSNGAAQPKIATTYL